MTQRTCDCCKEFITEDGIAKYSAVVLDKNTNEESLKDFCKKCFFGVMTAQLIESAQGEQSKLH